MKHVQSANEAVSDIKSGERIFFHSVAATPQTSIDALVNRAKDLQNVEIVHIHTEGMARYVEEQFQDNFHANVFFIGSNTRQAINDGRASYLPVFLSETPNLFRNNIYH